MSRVKARLFGLPRRKQAWLSAAVILAGLFALSSPPIAPYFGLVFWGANIGFWIGVVLFFIVWLIVAAWTTKL